MKWFKHDADANMDAKLQEVLLDYGLEGYGLYWYCLELIVNKVSADNITFSLEHDARVIARNTGSTIARVESIMRKFIELGLFEHTGDLVTCLKLAKRIDKSMTNSKPMRDFVEKLRTSDVMTNQSNVMTKGTNVMTTSAHVMTSSDNVMIEENRIEENRILKANGASDDTPKNKKSLAYSDEFETIWSLYPKRAGSNPKNKAFQSFNARLKEGYTVEQMEAGVKRYAKYCDLTDKTNTEFVLQASTFFGPRAEFTTEYPTSQPEGKRNSGLVDPFEGGYAL